VIQLRLESDAVGEIVARAEGWTVPEQDVVVIDGVEIRVDVLVPEKWTNLAELF